jgi:integrase
MRLTAKAVDALALPDGKADVIHFDDDLPGFGFRLRRSGDRVGRSWCVQYRRGGATRRMTLSSVLTCEQARGEAKRLLALVALGQDPQGEKQQARASDRHTLGVLIRDYLAAKEGTIRERSMIETRRYLTGSYFKSLHGRPVDSVLRKDVASCLLTISQKHGQVAASRARSAISALFVWSMQNGLCESNPVIGTAPPKAAPPRSRALSDDEIVKVWKAAGDDDFFGRIVKLLILLGARRTEVGGLRWSEIDLDRAVWVLPSERAKNGKEHSLPLPSLAVEIIRSVPEVVDRDALFGARGLGFTGWATSKRRLDDRLGDTVRPFVLHDIRRSVATRMCDLGVEPHVVEEILNHQSGHRRGIVGVYNKSTYKVAVQRAMTMWNNHIAALVEGRSAGSTVIAFPQASAAAHSGDN